MRAEATQRDLQNQWQLCCIKSNSAVKQNARSRADRPAALPITRLIPSPCTNKMSCRLKVEAGSQRVASGKLKGRVLARKRRGSASAAKSVSRLC